MKWMNPYEPSQSSLESAPNSEESPLQIDDSTANSWFTILKIFAVLGLLWFETFLGIMLLERLLFAVGLLSSSELQDADFLMPYFVGAFCGIGLFLWWWGRKSRET